MDRQQQQHIQLAPPSRGSPAANDATMVVVVSNDGTRLVQMCPSLYLAAYRGRMEEVMALLLQQHCAATAECYQSTGIIQHGQCDILEVSTERNTVLHVAAEQGHDELIRELYLRFREEQGLLSRRNSALDTPLHCAARAGHVRAIAVLVQLAGQDFGESILGCKNEAGDTALHLAARHGHGNAVEVLVLAAAEPAAELNKAGVSPLYLAVMSGSVQAVRAIVSTCSDASAVGSSSQNALHAAVFQSLEMVEMLLEWRPALADQADRGGSSPLHFAASHGDQKVIQAILRAAPPGTVYRKDSISGGTRGWPAGAMATPNKSKKITTPGSSSNSDQFPPLDSVGLSALHVAARMGHNHVVKELLRSYPDAAELRDGNGGTFVHAAAREKRYKVVSLAIKNPMLRGILDAQDRDGNTPLHLAVDAGAPDVVEALLWKGKVRADVLNNKGRTAFDLAAGSTNFLTTVKLVVTLVAFGAQLRPQRHDHLTPWSDESVVEMMEKMSDSLAVVAVLIATVAFTAGFNVPGGYGDMGEASLARKRAFKAFLFLDTVAMATSMAAVSLLVFGKASRSAGSWNSFASSWNSFAWALQLMWVSLFTLILAFYAALVAVVTTMAVSYGFLVVLVCMLVLQFRFVKWLFTDGPNRCTICRFIWQRYFHSKGRHGIIKLLYPLVGASVFHFYLLTAVGFVGFICIDVGALILPGIRLGSSHAPAPSPL